VRRGSMIAARKQAAMITLSSLTVCARLPLCQSLWDACDRTTLAERTQNSWRLVCCMFKLTLGDDRVHR
jgi:hypothetical protein